MTEQVTTTPAEAIAALGLTVDAVFVPFSQSRNKDKAHRSLNWRFTLKRNGRDVLTGDYSAGEGHCPSYNVKTPRAWDRPEKMWKPSIVEFETETGFKARWFTYLSGFSRDHAAPILPDPISVIWSCLMDADAIDHPSFESWAADYGYDSDSRTAKATYRTCLNTGLKMRAALGDDGLRQLRDAFQDY